jgi:hypothetical protein
MEPPVGQLTIPNDKEEKGDVLSRENLFLTLLDSMHIAAGEIESTAYHEWNQYIYSHNPPVAATAYEVEQTFLRRFDNSPLVEDMRMATGITHRLLREWALVKGKNLAYTPELTKKIINRFLDESESSGALASFTHTEADALRKLAPPLGEVMDRMTQFMRFPQTAFIRTGIFIPLWHSFPDVSPISEYQHPSLIRRQASPSAKSQQI